MATLEDLATLQSLSDDAVLLATLQARRAFRSVDPARVEAAIPALRRELQDVIDGYGYGLSAVAADWYADARAESPARGRFVPRTFTGLSEDEMAALVGWSVKPLFGAEPDRAAALARLEGGVQRTVTNAARDTIVGNVRRDPAHPSYYRGASSTCCAFCAVLTTRIYRSEDAAGFKAHDHDKCFPVPFWPGQPLEQPDYYGDFQAAYDDAKAAARMAGEPVVMPSGRQRRDTVLWRIRQSTGRK